MKRRILSLVLVLVMVFSAAPIAAFAEGVDVAMVGDTGFETVEDAFSAAANGQTVELIANSYGDIVIPSSFSGTLKIGNATIKSITAENTANIEIAGDVVVENSEGSAITGKVLNISGTGTLTAIANGDHAYGIGGDETQIINIENIHILNVKGGHVQPLFVNDTKYGKTEPEGGAAIGSGYDGAVINLTNVTIDNAQGGSKAAGIGARYWTGVTINITGCTIKNVEGGNASAGIGGSRVSSGATEQGVTITITNSNITAKGGQAGAGIGSGYDTHCQENQPICTINIDGSTINAILQEQEAHRASGVRAAPLREHPRSTCYAADLGDRAGHPKAQTAQSEHGRTEYLLWIGLLYGLRRHDGAAQGAHHGCGEEQFHVFHLQEEKQGRLLRPLHSGAGTQCHHSG